MELSTVVSAADFAALTMKVDAYNKTLNSARAVKQVLDKDDFLKILLTQLTHQDPTRPMEDTEFVAQMAQFSSLEQMSNMNSELGKVLNILVKSQALALLGKSVEIMEVDEKVTGIVKEVAGGEYPQILVNGKYYDISQVERVKN